MAYRDTPAYQRAVLRLAKLNDPVSQGIINTVAADQHFAPLAMRNKIWAMRQGAQRDAREKSLDLSKKSLNSNISLANEKLDMAEDDRNWGTGVGIADLLVSGYTGNEERKRKVAMADKVNQLYDKWLEK